MSSQQQLALFDFDGTLIRYDSLFQFLRFFRGSNYFIFKMFLSLPVLVWNKLGFINNSDAKERLLSNFFKGKTVMEFSVRAENFAKEKISNMLNKYIANKFYEHIAKGDRVIIISASVEEWILPWAQQWKVEVLATKLASSNGMLTGKFLGNNCNGEEKAKRIKNHLKLADYEEVWAYGDSSGDKAMLSLANHKIYRGQIRD